MNEYKVDEYRDGFFESRESCTKKLVERLKELDTLGWTVIAVDGPDDWENYFAEAKSSMTCSRLVLTLLLLAGCAFGQSAALRPLEPDKTFHHCTHVGGSGNMPHLFDTSEIKVLDALRPTTGVPQGRSIYEISGPAGHFHMDYATYPGGTIEEVPRQVIDELEQEGIIERAFRNSPHVNAWKLKDY